MDAARAERIYKELRGDQVGGWTVDSFVDHGKSAVVLKAHQGAKIGALKVFDPDLVERFGRTVQLSRINRELVLVGQKHDCLIEILDGGECDATGYLFVVMEFLGAEWKPLREKLADIPRGNIPKVLHNVARAARFLEQHDLVHRDIKPENIAIHADLESAKLLDLGVIRPFGADPLTDEEGRPFIGTLRYSSPEFLVREEQDEPDAWRAVTFYQLGGVLHDLLTGKSLFEEYSEPYARLVEAVRSMQPSIEADDVDQNLVVLCGNCLVKSPDTRLRLVSWSSFLEFGSHRSSTADARERVHNRRIAAEGIEAKSPPTAEHTRRRESQLISDAQRIVQSSVRLICVNNDDFPQLEIQSPSLGVRTATFFVLFSPSPAHALGKFVSVRINVRLIDVDGRVFEICASTQSTKNVQAH